MTPTPQAFADRLLQEDSLEGKTVLITRGLYRGQEGVVLGFDPEEGAYNISPEGTNIIVGGLKPYLDFDLVVKPPRNPIRN